jgi:hypothetical protein
LENLGGRGSEAQECKFFAPPGVDPFGPKIETDDTRRRVRIVADPKLVEIVRAFADEVSWQRLRVAFEKITALVGQSGKDTDALIKHGYATRSERVNFKANVEDHRHSGVKAVHGTHRGPLKGSKMTEKEGLAFIVRLFNHYLKKNPV